MQLTEADGQRLAREGLAALRRGDAAAAYSRLIMLKRGAPGMPVPWLLIAQAAGQLGNDVEAEEALAAYLKEQPSHLGALLMMGGIKMRLNNERAAQNFYRAALAVAAQAPSSVTPMIQPMIREAEAVVAAAGARFSAHLTDAIGRAGLATGAAGGRIRHAIDLLFGRSEVYAQQPSMFYFPGLAQRPFFEREEFSWLAALEARTAAMRDEVVQVMNEDAGFDP